MFTAGPGPGLGRQDNLRGYQILYMLPEHYASNQILPTAVLPMPAATLSYLLSCLHGQHIECHVPQLLLLSLVLVENSQMHHKSQVGTAQIDR